MHYVIRDWMDNDFDGKEYETFADGIDAVYTFASELCDGAVKRGDYEADSDEYEEHYNGICEDLYVIAVDEDGNEIKDADYTI